MHRGKTEKNQSAAKGTIASKQKTEVAMKTSGNGKHAARGNKVFHEIPKVDQEFSHEDFAAKANNTSKTRGNNLHEVANEMPDFAKSQANVS